MKITRRLALILCLPLALLGGCSGTKSVKHNGATPDKKPAAPSQPDTKAPSKTPDAIPADAVSQFLQAYVGAIFVARSKAAQLKGVVRIQIDRETQKIQVLDDMTDKQLAVFPYPAGVQVLQAPTLLRVLATRKLDFEGKDWDRRHPPAHAFLRFYRERGDFSAQLINYK